MTPRELNAVVVLRREVHPRLLVLRVAPTGWPLPELVPGQYATLGLYGSAARSSLADTEEAPPRPDKLILRAYSIASSSRAREYLELYVNLIDSGQLTPRLFALKPGDPLYLKPGFKGVFTLAEVPPQMQVVLIATGTGLAPYMSMLRTHLERGGTRRWAVLLGARHARDLGYDAELRELGRACQELTYHSIISRPQEESTPWTGPVGRVQELWQQGVLARAWGVLPTPADTHVFLCGNPAMITEMTALLASEGFVEHRRGRPGQVHVEVYW